MKRIAFPLVVTLFLALATASFAAELKFGYADIQKIVFLSDAGKEAKDQMSIKGAALEAEKNAREDALKKLSVELERQGVLLNESARMAKEKDYKQKLKEYQRFKMDAQDELKDKNDELTNRIAEDIVKITQEYGRKNGYTFIFVKDNFMVFADDKVDLTDELMKLFNASKKK